MLRRPHPEGRIGRRNPGPGRRKHPPPTQRRAGGFDIGQRLAAIDLGLALAEQIPTGIVHINDQTVNDEAVAPFGGVLDSGTGARFGGQSNLDAFTDQRWITLRGQVPAYPF